MEISAFSPASIWASVTRALTNFGAGALNIASVVNATLAANSTATFQQATPKYAILTFAVTADATGSVLVQFTDATNTWLVQTIAAGATGGQDTSNSTTGVFWQFHNNSATIAVHYWYCGAAFVQ